MPLGSPFLSSGRVSRRDGALGEDIDRRVEPDGDRPLVEQLARARIDEGAAAGRDHPHLAVDQPRDQPPLAVAEILLAVALEHLGGGVAGGVLDRRVAVDEGQAEPLGQPPPDRRLSHSHQPDEHHRPVETLRQIHHLKGLYSGSPRSAKAPAMPRIACPDHRPRARHRRACSSFRPLPKEQPTHTIEVDVPQGLGQCALSRC